MKHSEKCAKPAQAPKPNLKNKNFVKWSKAESCKKDDNIVSTDWHETLKTTNPFVPAYDNVPVCMNYLLSGEYGRIWQKERDDWYKNVFVPKGRDKEMADRRNKIRRAAKAAKKKAEKEAKERKERKAKEAEAKAKIEAERAEKIKARAQKCAEIKKTESQKKKKKDTKEEPVSETTELKKETCPKSWVPVELTVQCECSDHKKETKNPEQKDAPETDSSPTRNPEINHNAEESCVMCGDYFQQIKNIENHRTDAAMEQCKESPNSEKENRTPLH